MDFFQYYNKGKLWRLSYQLHKICKRFMFYFYEMSQKSSFEICTFATNQLTYMELARNLDSFLKNFILNLWECLNLNLFLSLIWHLIRCLYKHNNFLQYKAAPEPWLRGPTVLCRCTGTRSPRCSAWRWDPTWTLPSSPSAQRPSTCSSSGRTSHFPCLTTQ